MSIFNKLDYYFSRTGCLPDISLYCFMCYVIYSYRAYLPFINKNYWLLAQSAHYKFQLWMTNGCYRCAPTITRVVAQAVVSKTV